MTDYVVSDGSLTSVADAIRAKGGTSAPLAFPAGFVSAIDAIPTGGGGGGGVSPKDVNFVDYDGTVLHAYTAQEFAALSAMPANPDHSGDKVPLTSQGWNWKLSDAKTQVASSGCLDIGQMYIPTDGKTHIFISIDPNTPANRRTFNLYFGQSAANAVTVDWGDGTTPESYSETSATVHSHTYAAGGGYHITMAVANGKTLTLTGTSSSSGYTIYGSKANTNAYNRSRIRKILIGSGVTSVGSYTFYNCYSLTSITIPSAITSIGTYAFYYCYGLSSITIPDKVTSVEGHSFDSCYTLTSITIPNDVTNIGNSSLYNCYGLTSIAIPDSVTSMGTYAIGNCYGLTSVTIPGDATSIGNNAFQSCPGISEYHIKPTTPPTLTNTNTFSSIASDCVMYVPYSEDHSILNEYKTASNWSTYASYMQEEPA